MAAWNRAARTASDAQSSDVGIGFVLFAWAIVGMVVAVGCSILLGELTWRATFRLNRPRRIRSVVAIAALPPVCVVCGLAGFVWYAAWCESRGVDPGMGDSATAPIGSGYQLVLGEGIRAYVESPKREQFELVADAIGIDTETIYFETAGSIYQLIEKASGRTSTGLSRSELTARLQTLGQPAPRFRSPAQAYSDFRWSARDLLAIPMIIGLPFILSTAVGGYVRSGWRKASTSTEHA
jgi:hypothetical protein